MWGFQLRSRVRSSLVPDRGGMPEVPGTNRDLTDALALKLNKNVIRIKSRNRVTERKTR